MTEIKRGNNEREKRGENMKSGRNERNDNRIDIMTLLSLVGGYQGETYYLHIYLKMEAVCPCETLVTTHEITWCHKLEQYNEILQHRAKCTM
jgi:hypothetical protein